jgi:PelA/Pel-15E family pectate lyase
MGSNARGFLVGGSLVLVAAAASVCAQPPRVQWNDVLRQDAAWYRTAEAAAVADNVLRYQRESGGWPKDIDMVGRPAGPPPARPDATIDNGATTTQIRFLAHFAADKYRKAAIRGIDYLLDAQYPNGGWPQFFPVRQDYSRYITFNDDAMVNALLVLEDVAAGTEAFGFVDAGRRERAAAAVRKATPLILKSQVTVSGTRTVWGAQHDEVTLEPRNARAFEPVALASAESVGIVRFLMRRPKTPEVAAAVDAAVAWFKASRLPDGRWARFYEIGTNRPIFAGRDGIVRYSLEEIEEERREGYAWYGTWPRNLVEKAHPAWR